MTPQEIDRIECAIRHIRSAVDVDPWAVEIAVEAMERMASANLQPNLQQTCNQLATDTISRQAAIDAVETKIKKWNAVDGEGYHVGLGLRYTDVIDTLTELPSAQPDLSGYSDRLWTAAYERGKAEAQPNIIHCGDCKYYHDSDGCFFSTATTGANGFCHWAERKEGEADEAN